MIAIVSAARASSIKQVLRVAATYIGTVVGAGFASGQETMRFFGAYGRSGLVGLALATALFCTYGILIMEFGRRLGARSHKELLYHVCGPVVGRVMDIAITLFLGATLVVMVAGGGAVFKEQLGISRAFGTLLTAGLAGYTILAGMRGIITANSIVVPLLIIAVIGLSAATIHFHGIAPILARTVAWPLLAPVKSWFFASWLYVAYNLVLSISILAPLGNEVKSRRAIYAGGLLGGLALGVLGLGIKLAVSAHMPQIGKVEVPMLFLARLHSSPVQWAYMLILWAEIYTTALACAYGFSSRVAEVFRGSYRHVVVIVTAIALFGSGFGFSALLTVLYPLFGLLTLVVLAGLSHTALKGLWQR